MKKVFVTMISIFFLLLPAMAYTQSGQLASNAPPVSQPLVPEGVYALKLATALKLGTPTSEAQAEDMLSSVGIAPKNGWIADYPVTPDIIGELQEAVVASADEKKLPMGRDEALKAFQGVAAEFGLAVAPGSPGQYAEAQPQRYTDPTIINNYYYEEGPPVVTYYPPPWDYNYLYAWVPYPFWWGGFFFSGFFCLNNFHKVVFVGNRRCLVTNNVRDPATRQVSRINPNGRRMAETPRTANSSTNRGFNNSETRRGAASIFERSNGRVSSFNDRNRTIGNNAGRDRSTLGTGTEISLRGPSAREGRSFNGSSGSSDRSFRSSSEGNRSLRSSESSGRTFSGPSRSFSGSSSRGSNFSCQNCHGGSSSFSRGGGGGSSRSFSGSGFSGGRSSGGFSGGGFSSSRSSGGFSGGSFSRGGGFSGGRGGGGGRGR